MNKPSFGPGTDVIVIGGGPTGLGVAHRLLSRGIKCTLLESRSRFGGLSQTFDEMGCKVDYGPHILHTSKEDIIRFLQSLLKSDLVERKAKVQVYFNGKFVPYPIKGIRALTVLPLPTAMRASFDLLAARFLRLFRNDRQDRSFDAWIRHRFGRTLYGIYFGPYAEKVWKIPASEISAYVAVRRVPEFRVIDYLRRIVKMKPKQFHTEDPECVRVYYPRRGIGQVVDALTAELKGKAVDIRTNSEVTEIQWTPGRVTGFRVREETGERERAAEFFLSTIPVNQLVRCFRPLPPEEVVAAADGLDFVAEHFLYLVVKKEKVFDATLTYFQNPSVKFNRVYSVRSLSPDCVPSGGEVICVEYTCSRGDDVWNASADELFRNAMGVFTSIGVLRHEDVASHFSKKVDLAYPRFRVDYEKKLGVLFDFLESFENLAVLGRQGLFCYANVDDALGMAFQTVDRLLMNGAAPMRYREWYKEFIHPE